ncbi:G-protein coupled receptor Mth2 [Pseudomyrmex gracilis]|uniref:G-protein coupled receptor Mth2 n=1 Tax=Pseudomyrmex gracilis TaxID=219809 RepID=UPI000994F3F9|nr:G-protein coupled receptor Mth2 [Pseudomyrmex gracilis]XP_020285010.1 G-protein coupled receptor Mth2 [Pseudomyrmex gracilis]
MFAANFILLVLSLTKVSSELYLTKCCEPGKIFSGQWNTSEVNCVSVPNSSRMEAEVFQWNATAVFQGFPRCDEPEDITITPLYNFDNNFEEIFEMPACLETLHEQTSEKSVLIAVHCRSYKDERNKTFIKNNVTFPPFAHVRKCCPSNEIFDTRAKTCVRQTNESQNLVEFLPNRSTIANLSVTTTGPPKCTGPIVDYTIDKDDVFLRNANYWVTVSSLKNNLVFREEFLASENSSCLDVMPYSERKLVARVCRDPDYCDRNACIRKCCAEGEVYAKGCSNLTVPDEPKEFHEAFANALNQTKNSNFISTKDYGVLIGKPCTNGMYPINPRREDWWLSSDNHVFVNNYHEPNDVNGYCMDILKRKSDYNFYLFLCFPEKEKDNNQIRLLLNFVLLIVSCVFSLITLLVYACLPSLRNLHGKTLMCYVSSLLSAYICLAITYQINANDAPITCKVVAYTMLFSFLSAFSWLNVMCFDIWWTFGVQRGSTIARARGHKKRFLLYCLNAWGLSFVLSSLTIFADCTDILPKYLKPDIAIERCWFSKKQSSYSELIFFIAPVTIQLMSNVTFFIFTLVHYNKVKIEIQKVSADTIASRRFHSNRNRFIMNVKLFIVMGIVWTFEVISYFLNNYFQHLTWKDVFLYTTDVLNCLQGLLIFILFVLKTRVYLALRKRMGLNTKGNPTPTCNATTTLQDPYKKVRRSTSSSTLTTTFVISSAKSSS